MNALTVFIRRPVLATMVTVLLSVLGAFSLRGLGVDLLPKVEIPIVTVTTTLRGASPEEIETLITKPIEESINTVAGIDELTSYSFEGMSRVIVRFDLDQPLDESVQDVRDKVASVLRNLPVGTDMPTITRVDFDAVPVLTLTVSADRDLKEVSEFARLKVKESLENVAGVGALNVIGARKRAVNVILDVDKLRALNIPISVVKAQLNLQNIEIPSGRVDRGDSEQTLRTLGRIQKVKDFEQIVIAERNDRQVTLGDIGRVEDSVEEPRSMARYWKKGEAGLGRPTVSMDVIKQSGTNTVEVIRNVKKRLEMIAPLLPKGYNIDIVADQSVFIIRSLDELELHLILGAILAAFTVLLFMRNLRSTLIAAVAIPTSLIATFTIMRALDFTLNNMSLLGLTLAVGIVIDDAIVVLENIFRHIEEYRKTPFQAAVDGLKEIGLAVMATTTSLVVIFLPVAFMQGIVGRFFYEFGITTAFAIGISLLISMTLTPMLSAQFLRQKKNHQPKAEVHRDWLTRGYLVILRFCQRHPAMTMITALLLVLSSAPLAGRVGKDFIPLDDRSEFTITLTAQAGMSLSAVDGLFGKIEAEVRTLPGVERTLTQIGSGLGSEDITRGTIYVGLVDLEKRSFGQMDVIRKARALLTKYPEVRSSVNPPGVMGGGARNNVQFQYFLNGPDLDALGRYANQIIARLKQRGGLVDLDTSLSDRQPELRVVLDRKKAADLGLSATDVAATLRTMVGGEIATKFREGVEQYDVWLRLDRKDRDDADVVQQLPLQAPRIGFVPLSQVARLEPGKGPTEIDRYNRQRLVGIYANLDGLDLGTAVQEVERAIAEMKLPPTYGGVYMGQAKAMAEAMTEFGIAMLLAFVFMYIVLAAQFESFLHPVTILLSLPLTVPFALVSLLITSESLNLYSILGLFMLFGVVKKNGILQVDYSNTLIGRGMPMAEAILEANRARFRPILMTTLTLVVCMIPVALGKGPGTASRASLAKVIIGAQVLSLLITLVIVPVAYSLFERARIRLGFGRRVDMPSGEPAPSSDPKA